MRTRLMKNLVLLLPALTFALSILSVQADSGKWDRGSPKFRPSNQEAEDNPSDKSRRPSSRSDQQSNSQPRERHEEKRTRRPRDRAADDNKARPHWRESERYNKDQRRPPPAAGKDRRARIKPPLIVPAPIPDRDTVLRRERRELRHKPRYWEGPRHRYDYVRTPWYFSRYLAPIRRPYYRPGYFIKVMPNRYLRIMVGSQAYYYDAGIFYRPYNQGYIVVSAPLGAVIRTLPLGFIAFSIGLTTYYALDDDYYVWDDARDGYVVVQKPAGADEAIEEATAGRLFVYPNQGQDEEQQARDRYECHRWAVAESKVDPTLEDADLSVEQRQDYRRAISACLQGRGYTVK